MNRWIRTGMYLNAAVLATLALYFFLAPAAILVRDLRDPGLTNGEIPRFAWQWHRALSRSFGPWARARVVSGSAGHQDNLDVSATEWPVLSAVLYLWSTEALQEAWEVDNTLGALAPKVYAREPIDAASALVADPNHATWVREYWGDGYLKHDDLFYRSLLIAGMTSYQKLTGDDRYEATLSTQVETLSNEMDASPHGLLDDYPGECYPVDVLTAVAAIRRADAVLGTDHAGFVSRALRGFGGKVLDAETGLPAYVANARSGRGLGPSRGVGLSLMLNWAPELWPETAARWYTLYEGQYWEQGDFLAGFREFTRKAGKPEWWMEVDAGPVISGFGTVASAFGVAAARVNGRPDHGYALGSEALAASWPLPDGSRMGPRMLSSASDAPYIGETAMLFCLTRRPIASASAAGPVRIPWVVSTGLVVFTGIGLCCLVCSGVLVRRWSARQPYDTGVWRGWRVGAWVVLAIAGLALTVHSHTPLGLPLVLLTPFLVRFRKPTSEGDASEQ